MAAIKILSIPNTRTCRVLKRINRFVVHIEFENRVQKAHINNTGRLQELLVPGRTAFCFSSPHTLKTDFRLFAVEESGLGALIDTQLQMKAFETILGKGLLPWLKRFTRFKRNAPLGTSLIDYLLENSKCSAYLEIKSAVLRYNNLASYPDCPSLRGQRHIQELEAHVRAGGTGIVLFMAALPRVRGFRPDKNSDPSLYNFLKSAYKSGVQVKAVGLHFDPRESSIQLTNPDLPVDLS